MIMAQWRSYALYTPLYMSFLQSMVYTLPISPVLCCCCFHRAPHSNPVGGGNAPFTVVCHKTPEEEDDGKGSCAITWSSVEPTAITDAVQRLNDKDLNMRRSKAEVDRYVSSVQSASPSQKQVKSDCRPHACVWEELTLNQPLPRALPSLKRTQSVKSLTLQLLLFSSL